MQRLDPFLRKSLLFFAFVFSRLPLCILLIFNSGIRLKATKSLRRNVLSIPSFRHSGNLTEKKRNAKEKNPEKKIMLMKPTLNVKTTLNVNC